MPNTAKITFLTGLIVLILAVINVFTVDYITPSFQRAEVLSGMAGIGLMLIGFLWTEVNPTKRNPEKLEGQQGFVILNSLPSSLKNELEWGTELILTATAAATILIYYKEIIVLRRGIISTQEFDIGKISKRVIESKRSLILNKLKLYPGNSEFNSVLDNLPCILLNPIGSEGLIIVGGWSERCFTKSDEKWISGWASKISNEMKDINII